MPLQWRNQIWQSLEEGAGKQWSECARDGQFDPALTMDLHPNPGSFRPLRAREPCENPGGRPGLPVLKTVRTVCGRNATVNSNFRPPLGNFVRQARGL